MDSNFICKKYDVYTSEKIILTSYEIQILIIITDKLCNL
jgi:hypothetical protein